MASLTEKEQTIHFPFSSAAAMPRIANSTSETRNPFHKNNLQNKDRKLTCFDFATCEKLHNMSEERTQLEGLRPKLEQLEPELE